MIGTDSQPHPEKSQRTLAREAFFLEFARETRKRFPSLVLMLTGGFRSRAGAEHALRENACDLIGIGRPAAVEPAFAGRLLDESVPAEEAEMQLNKVKPPFLLNLLPIKAVGAGLETVRFLPSSVWVLPC
jgi:2,4-dienoyl-CoA reductase-like NADH-dependent reductase (Old Yellow Enzyme family)